MANRGSQFPGMPPGMNMIPQGQQHFVQPQNMSFQQRPPQYSGMMRFGPQGVPPGAQMMRANMNQPGMMRLPVNQQQQQRFMTPPAYTPQMAQNYQTKQQQRQTTEEQRRDFERKRQFQLQQQKLKQVTSGGGKSLDANVLLESMFGKNEAQKPKPAPAPMPESDGFGDFLQAPAGQSTPDGATRSMDMSHGAAQSDKQTTPSEAQPSYVPEVKKAGLDDMMMQCSDLHAPQKAKGFIKPAVREVQPQHHKTTSFKESQKARQWISTNTDELSTLFHLDAPLPPQAQKRTPPKANRRPHPPHGQPHPPHGQPHPPHGQPHPPPAQPHPPPAKPAVFSPPRWCVDDSLVPGLYKHALEATLKDGKIVTSLAYPILMRSGLPKEALGYVWSLANRITPGQLVKEELYMILALIALIQNNIPVHTLDVLLNCPRAPIPNLGQHVNSAPPPGQQQTQPQTSGAQPAPPAVPQPSPMPAAPPMSQQGTPVMSAATPSQLPPIEAFPDKSAGKEDLNDDDFDDFKCASSFTDSSSYSSSVRTDSNAETSSSDSSSSSSDLSKGMSTSRVMVFELSKNKENSPYNFFSREKEKAESTATAVSSKDSFGSFSSAPNGNENGFADFQKAESDTIAEAARQEQRAAFGKVQSSQNTFSAIKSTSQTVPPSQSQPAEDEWADFTSAAPAVPTNIGVKPAVVESKRDTLMSLEDDKYGALRDFEIAPETQPISVFAPAVPETKSEEDGGDDFGDFMTSPRTQPDATAVQSDLFSVAPESSNVVTLADTGKTAGLTTLSSSSGVKDGIMGLFATSQSQSATQDLFSSVGSNVVHDDEFADFASATSQSDKPAELTTAAASSSGDVFGDFSSSNTDKFAAFSSPNLQTTSSIFPEMSSATANGDGFADFASFDSKPPNNALNPNTGSSIFEQPPLTTPSSKPVEDDFADFSAPVKPKKTSKPVLAPVVSSWDIEPPPLDIGDDHHDDFHHTTPTSARSVHSQSSVNEKTSPAQTQPDSSVGDLSWKPAPPPLNSPSEDFEDFDIRPSPPPLPEDSPKTPTDSFFPGVDHNRLRRDYFSHQPQTKPAPSAKSEDASVSQKVPASTNDDFVNLQASASSNSMSASLNARVSSLRDLGDSQSVSSLDMFPGWTTHSADSQSVSSLDLPSIKNQSGQGSAAGDNQSTSSSEYGGLEMVKSTSNSDAKSLESLDLKPSETEGEIVESTASNDESFGDFSSAPPPSSVDNHQPAKTADKWISNPRSASELLSEGDTPIVGDRYSKLMNDVQDSDRHQVEWQRCLESACDLIKNANNTFNEISSSTVCREILNSQHGSEYLSCIVEVYRVVCRIIASKKAIGLSNPKLDGVLKNIDLAWNNLVAFIAGSHLMPDLSQFEYSHCSPTSSDSSSQHSVCGVCLLDVTDKPTANKNTDNQKLTYGGRQYHASCGNFWVNCVDSMLPALKVPELL